MPIHRRRAFLPLLAASVIGGSTGIAAAQVPAPPAAPTAPLEVMGMPVPGPRTSEDVTPAVRAIERMVMAYRAAPFLVDEMRMQEIYMGNPQPAARGRVILGAGTDCVIQTPLSRAVSLGDQFYFERDTIRSRYIQAPLEENIVHMMREVVRTRPSLGWQAKSRYGDPPDSVLFSLSFGVPDPTTITGYERVQLPDGRDVHRVTLMADSGWSVVTIDAKTDLLIAIDVDCQPRGTPIETFRITRHVRANPVVLDELPEPISFDPRDRRPVTTYNALIGRTITSAPVALELEVGETLEVPTMITLEGMPWAAADRDGRVQVVIAWNLGAVPFRRGDTAVKALRRQVEERTDGVPIDLWLLNTREDTEETDDGGGKWDAVYEYWYATDFEIPCLFDDRNVFADAVGLQDVPAVMVFDTRGRLVGTQGGLDESWLDLVNALIDSAVAASKDAESPAPADGEVPAGPKPAGG